MESTPPARDSATDGQTASTDPGTPERTVIAPEEASPGRLRRPRRMSLLPLLLLLAYYVAMVAAAYGLSLAFPLVGEALVHPVAAPSGGAEILVGDRVSGLAEPPGGAGGWLERSASTFTVILGALALVVPVAWVYMRTKRFRYDPALVSSVIILPIVVAGIAMVVKDSLALAFSLAGIVAAVRFRNTLKDPRDAVYIFLVIGIGLSAGVQVLDVALVMSILFNMVVLLLWRYNVGSVYGGRYARTGVLSIGPSRLLRAADPDGRERVRAGLVDAAEEFEADGILLVHAGDAQMARQAVPDAIGDSVKDWRLVRIVPGAPGGHTLEYLVRLKKKTAPPAILGALDERAAEQVYAAEYVAFRNRRTTGALEDSENA